MYRASLLVSLIAAVLFTAACSTDGGGSATEAAADRPHGEPAFPGQTDAPPPATPSSFKAETVAEIRGGWAVAFLPDGNYLVTQSSGTMRTISPDGKISEPIAGVPAVKSVAAQGLHDIVLDPNFNENRLVYFTYFAPPKGEEPQNWPIEHFYEDVWTKPFAERRTMNLGFERVARARLREDDRALEDVDVLAEGSERRVVFAPDGTMYVVGADRFRFYDSDLDGVEHDWSDEPNVRRNFTGRVLRINPDGTIPLDNPWLDNAMVPRDTFAHGFKDPEGAAINPATGELWVTDHGPQGGDEINIVRAGRDYGWPQVSYGVQYDERQLDGRTNVPVGTGLSSQEGIEEPIYYWIPSIAPSGMMFYSGDLFPDWKGDLFVGAMSATEGKFLVHLKLDGEHVVSEEHLLEGEGHRIREVRQGPDGAVYLLSDSALLRLTPQ